jgi:periplasmic protein TonB
MEIARTHWLVAVAAAALVHAAVATAVFWKERAASAHSAGIGGIEISLGPAGGVSGARAAAASPPPPPEERPVVEKEPEPEKPVETPPVQQVDVAVQHDVLPPPLLEIVEQIAPTEQKPEPEPKPVEPPKPVVEAPPTPKAKPKVPETPKVAKKPAPPPEPQQEATPTPAETQVAMSAPSASGTEGKAGTRNSRNAGDADDSNGGGIPGEVVDYMSVLQAWLERHKEYPRGARLRRIEGTTLLYFVMDRSGRVIDYRIEKSSGFELLDHEVEAMIRRAQPLPAIPKDMNRQRLELVVPVQFLLR